MTRPERRERWESLFDPTRLALTGVALSAALLCQPHLAGRIAILLAAAAAAWLSGRKLSPLMTVMVIASIVGANLLVPLGKKLASLGPITITEIALLEGLEKAITFEALMFISKACLGPACACRASSAHSSPTRCAVTTASWSARVRYEWRRSSKTSTKYCFRSMMSTMTTLHPVSTRTETAAAGSGAVTRSWSWPSSLLPCPWYFADRPQNPLSPHSTDSRRIPA